MRSIGQWPEIANIPARIVNTTINFQNIDAGARSETARRITPSSGRRSFGRTKKCSHNQLLDPLLLARHRELRHNAEGLPHTLGDEPNGQYLWQAVYFRDRSRRVADRATWCRSGDHSSPAPTKCSNAATAMSNWSGFASSARLSRCRPRQRGSRISVVLFGVNSSGKKGHT
jgi:hypothetical protein